MVCLGLCACGGDRDSHEAVAVDLIAIRARLGGILEGVRTEAAAREAAEKILALSEELQAVVDRQKALDGPTPAEDDALSRKFRDDLKAASARIARSMERLHADPKLWSVLEKALATFRRIKPK